MFEKFRTFDAIAEINRIDRKRNITEKDLERQRKYIRRLVNIGEAAMPQLIEELGFDGAKAPGAPFPMVIHRIGEVAIPYLSRGANSRNQEISRNSIIILGEMATDGAVAALHELLSNKISTDWVKLAIDLAEVRRKQRHFD